MKTIYTRFHGPTNTRPSRITAWTDDGQRLTLTMGKIPDEYDQKMCKDDAHMYVAQQLRDKFKWKGRLVASQVKRGWVFTFDPEGDRLLAEAAQELYQLHQHEYVKCSGGCPAIDIVMRIERLTGVATHPSGVFLDRPPANLDRSKPYSRTIAIHDAMKGC